MANQPLHFSGNVKESRSRVDAALERLEQAAGPGGPAAAEQAELAELDNQLGTARGEIARLQGANEQVSKRLDAAIGKVKALIGD